jgi:hypothetical protein
MSTNSITYCILETSFVPFGHEPTILCYEDGYEAALATVEWLKAQPDAAEFCYEFCEA